MTSLLIVGHPYSDYQFVETALHAQGMHRAKNSRREQLTPVAINQQLLKTQQVIFDHHADICQLKTGEIWNELALDLLLGNIDQTCWGWADPQTILLLDYWRKAEPQLKFLLLYDQPEIVFSRIFHNKQISAADLEQAVNYWNDFYEEILSFYHRNQSGCLLVNISAIRENKVLLAQVISNFMQCTLADTEQATEMNLSTFSINDSSQLLMTTLLEEKEYAILHASYEGLQAVANMPLTVSEISSMEQVIAAWNTEQPLVKKEPIQYDLGQEQVVKELKEENELLLLQLHQVQEELEHYFLENQKLKNGDTRSTATSPSFYNEPQGSPSFHYGAADRIKRQLSYRLGATMIQQSRTVRGMLMMPWALIKETKAFRKDFNARKHEKLPSITEYQDAYEAERVKQHLSYRLGYTMVKNTNSVLGWIKLPWLLKQEILDFQKRRRY